MKVVVVAIGIEKIINVKNVETNLQEFVKVVLYHFSNPGFLKIIYN